MTMEDVKNMLETILGMSVLRTALSLLIGDGSTKRCAQYAFALIQLAVLFRMLRELASVWLGAWK